MRQPLTKFIPWWVVVLEGAAALVAGAGPMDLTALTGAELVRALGAYWLAIGILWIVGSFESNAGRMENRAGGILGVIIGLAASYYNPAPSSAMAFYAGIIGVIIGLIGLYIAYRSKIWGHGVTGILNIILGLVVSVNLGTPYWAGAISVIGGIITILAGFALLSSLRGAYPYPRTVPATRRVEPPMGAGVDPVEGGDLPDADTDEDEAGNVTKTGT